MAANHRALRLNRQTTNPTVLNVTDRMFIPPSNACATQMFPAGSLPGLTCKTDAQTFRPANPCKGILNRFRDIYCNLQHPTRDDGAPAMCVRCEVLHHSKAVGRTANHLSVSTLPRMLSRWRSQRTCIWCTRLHETDIVCAVDVTAKPILICQESKKKNQCFGCCLTMDVLQWCPILTIYPIGNILILSNS